MSVLLVVGNPKRWPLRLRGAQVVSAKEYLTEPRFGEMTGAKVFNLCRTYGYQTLGYYVSLLAAARGHRPLPSVDTLRDLRMTPIVRMISSDLDELTQRSLKRLKGDEFELSIYFGRNLARGYDRLAGELFNQFPAPFLRAWFEREGGRWRLDSIAPIGMNDIPDRHRPFLVERAEAYFGKPTRRRTKEVARYDLAILVDPSAEDSPSNSGAIKRFQKAAEAVGLAATLIEKSDAGRVAEFDALFIRATTMVEHYTYRFSRRAAAAGIVVIDDPQSILRCTNKVFQSELFDQHGIPTPRTILVHEGNRHEISSQLGLPLVLKRPDAAFSRGVVKVKDEAELDEHLDAFLADSDLVLAQEFAPTDFDWRIGTLGGKALYACRYHMVKGHWQIASSDKRGRRQYGNVDAVPIEEAPRGAVRLAERAAKWIGDGLYGVDIKQKGRKFVVIEVNDNPNLDHGVEDHILGDELYLTIMRWFREKLDARGTKGAGR